MFIMTAKFPGKKLLPLLPVLLLCLLALLLPSKKESGIPGGSNEERLAYLTSLGWEVDEACVEKLDITLPKALDGDFTSYNEMQKTQGFDLSPLAGKTLTRVTYRVKNHPMREDAQANLYIYDGNIVAGDIICTGKNGFISDLKFPQKQ